MSAVHGSEGTVNVGTDLVAKVQDFSLQIEVPTSDASGMGDTWETHSTGAAKRWSGTINAYRVPGDAGQTALAVGSLVNIHLYGDGNSSGKEYYSGQATITGMGRTQNKNDTVAVSFDFLGQGELTTPTVT